MNLPAQQPFWFDPPRSSPLKDASGDGGSDHQLSPHRPSRGQECNRHWRDQRPQSPRFPSPSSDLGFESNQSSLSMASSILSRSNRSDRSSNIPELEVRFNSILTCRVQELHPPTLCNKILARLSQRVSTELWYGYNLG